MVLKLIYYCRLVGGTLPPQGTGIKIPRGQAPLDLLELQSQVPHRWGWNWINVKMLCTNPNGLTLSTGIRGHDFPLRIHLKIMLSNRLVDLVFNTDINCPDFGFFHHPPFADFLFGYRVAKKIKAKVKARLILSHNNICSGTTYIHACCLYWKSKVAVHTMDQWTVSTFM